MAVLSGHDHSYERVVGPDGFPYMVRSCVALRASVRRKQGGPVLNCRSLLGTCVRARARPWMQVNGMGGARTYGFQVRPIEGSAVRFTSRLGGAQLIVADEHTITFR